MLTMRLQFLTAFLMIALLNGCENETPRAKADQPQAPLPVAELHHEKGLQAIREEQYHQAVQFFQQAVALAPEEPSYWNNLGRTWYKLGEYDQALQALNRAAQLAPGDAQVRINIADVYRQSERMDEAITHYHGALQIAPDLPTQARIHYELGNLYLKQERHDLAEYRLNKAIQFDPGLDRAYLARVILYHLTQRDDKAWADVLHLERRGMQIRQDLRDSILDNVRASQAQRTFRPGY